MAEAHIFRVRMGQVEQMSEGYMPPKETGPPRPSAPRFRWVGLGFSSSAPALALAARDAPPPFGNLTPGSRRPRHGLPGRAPRCRGNAGGTRAARGAGSRAPAAAARAPRMPRPGRIRSLGPGPGSRWCARRDAEAQLGTPVTARAPAAPGGPARRGSVRETDPLSVGPPRRIRASAGGGVLHAAPWGLPPRLRGRGGGGEPRWAAGSSGLSCPHSRHPLRCGPGSPASPCALAGGIWRPGPEGDGGTWGGPRGGGSASEKLQNNPGSVCLLN